MDRECAASPQEATSSRRAVLQRAMGQDASHKLGFLGHRVEAPALSFHFPFIQTSAPSAKGFTCAISFNVCVHQSSGCRGDTEGPND